MDQCKNCTLRGNIEGCLRTPCSHHESWMAQVLLDMLREARDSLNATIADAVAVERERCANICDGVRYAGYVPAEDGAAAAYYGDASGECADQIRAISNEQK